MDSTPEDKHIAVEKDVDASRAHRSDITEPAPVMLIACDDCGELISVRAEFCSHCGARGNVPRLVLPGLSESKPSSSILSSPLRSIAKKLGLGRD